MLGENQQLVFANQQGKGGYAKLYHCRTREYSLSSIIRFRPGKPGYQEHVQHLSLSPEALIWVNHPAEIYKHGDGRPCFWAGNGILPDVVQHEGIALMMFDIPADHNSDWTHAYFPTHSFTEWVRHENWHFARLIRVMRLYMRPTGRVWRALGDKKTSLFHLACVTPGL